MRPIGAVAAEWLTILAIVVLSSIAGMLFNGLRSDPLGVLYRKPDGVIPRSSKSFKSLVAAEQKDTRPCSSPPPSVTLSELERTYSDPTVLVVDARPPVFFHIGHIPGALNFPRRDFQVRFKELEPQLKSVSRKKIIVYCASRTCEDSTLLYRALCERGFTNVVIFEGGWEEWSNSIRFNGKARS